MAALRSEVERLRNALAESGQMHRRGDRASDRTNPSVVEALQSHVDEVRPSGVGTTHTPCKHVYMSTCAGIHKERERVRARARARQVAEAWPGQHACYQRLVNPHVQQEMQELDTATPNPKP